MPENCLASVCQPQEGIAPILQEWKSSDQNETARVRGSENEWEQVGLGASR